MCGYILNLFRHATFPSSIKSNMREYLNTLADKKTSNTPSLLAYGDYDRLSIKPVFDFSRYRDVDIHAQHWLGSRQTILIYRLDNSADLDEDTDLLSDFCALHDAKITTPIHEYRNFLIFTMVTINPDLHKYNDFAHILGRCRELIAQQVRANSVPLIDPDAISYQVYGSFSSSELVIVWSVNQYVDAFRLIEVLRQSSFEYKTKDEQVHYVLPFSSLYSIVSQPIVDLSNFHNHQKIQGSAEIKFVFQDGVDDPIARMRFFAEVLCNQCSDSDSICTDNVKVIGQHSVGEYDYSITLPADVLCNPKNQLFRRGHALHWANDEMHKYVSSSCVQLHHDMDCFASNGHSLTAPPLRCQELASLFPVEEESLSDKIQLVKRMIYGQQGEYSTPASLATPEDAGAINLFEAYRKRGLRSIIKERIPETDGLCDSLDLLYTDFVNNCTNLTNTSWSLDLVTQFAAIVDYIVTRFDVSYQPGKSTGTLFSDIKNICEIYVQMIYHIAQSRRTVFIVPSCHLRYMGQYDMILHAYYGWEKYLLNLAYTLPRRNGIQPILIPILTIDVLPQIRTDIYKVTHHYQSEARLSNIFSINMPLGAMTDFLRYALTMCHETAHLIVPFDRDRRNQVFGMMFFSEMVANLLLLPVRDEFWKDDSAQENYSRLLPVIRRGVIAVIYNHMRLFFLDHIHAVIMDGCKNKPGSCPPWSEYNSKLKGRIVELFQEQKEFMYLFDALSKYHHIIQQVVYETIDAISWDNQHGESAYLIKKEFFDELKEKLKNTITAQLITKRQDLFSVYQTFIDTYGGQLCMESYLLSGAYREACQDLFMIRVFQLDLVDYLVFLDRQRNDTVMLDQKPLKAELLRTAMVSDYMLTEQVTSEVMLPEPREIMPLFDKLNSPYVSLFMQVPEMRTKDKNQKARLLQRVKDRFLNMRKELELYYGDYSIFRPLLLEQLKSADPFVQAPEIQEQLRQNGMRRFYDNWKSAIQTSDEGNEEANREMHQKIFSNNIHMIQRYQTQPTFESLALKLEGRD